MAEGRVTHVEDPAEPFLNRGSTEKQSLCSDVERSAMEEDKALESEVRQSRCTGCLKDNAFLLLTCVGITVGFLIGLTVRLANPSLDALIWIGMPGELYMRILKATILPLIVCSVIDGTANTDPGSHGRIGVVSLCYIIISNSLGGVIGITLALIIRPGSRSGDDGSSTSPDTRNLQTIDIFADFIRNLFPDNIVSAALHSSQTAYKSREIILQKNDSGQLVNVTSLEFYGKSLATVPGTNLLGLIVISTAIGMAASRVRQFSRPFVNFFHAGTIIIFKLFDWIKWTTPVGVASLIAKALASVNRLDSAFTSMGMFVLTSVGGCLLYFFIVIPLVLLFIAKQNPMRFYVRSVKAILMGFASTSAAIAFPEQMQVAIDSYNVNPKIADVTLPLCMTLNRVGSCIFISAAAIFVGQITGTTIDTGTVFTAGALCILSSLAVPPVPSASVVTLLIVLGSLRFPAEGIGLIMAVEWITDRVRTSINVSSNMMAVLVTWRLCRQSMRDGDSDCDTGLDNKEKAYQESVREKEEKDGVINGKAREVEAIV